MADGTAVELGRLKRIDAQARQKLATERLFGFDIRANPNCYHLWLTLPAQRSQSLAAGAARRDIALTPSTSFAVTQAMRQTPSGSRWQRRQWISSTEGSPRLPRCCEPESTISRLRNERRRCHFPHNARSSPWCRRWRWHSLQHVYDRHVVAEPRRVPACDARCAIRPITISRWIPLRERAGRQRCQAVRSNLASPRFPVQQCSSGR